MRLGEPVTRRELLRRTLVAPLVPAGLALAAACSPSNELGIHNGTALITLQIPGSKLRIRKEPSVKAEELISTDPRGDVSVSIQLENRTRVLYPEIVAGDNPDNDEKGTGRWIRIRRVALQSRKDLFGDPPMVTYLDGYVSISQATRAHVKLEPEQLDLLKKDQAGRYKHPLGHYISEERVGLRETIR
ncbi:hypothetical protein HYS97_02275 [Candidatus Daviesbacteria bacterium]|nr:hypothetical protein [Candidatus Daviesbacteria bacterium]